MRLVLAPITKFVASRRPSCFISYSWDGDEHKAWTRRLAEQIERQGVDVKLDQWDVHLGADLLQYMESAIRSSDFVLLVCTEEFAKKANSGIGGAGYEKSIVTGEIYNRVASATKFVPLLRTGSAASSLPSYLQSRMYADFRDDGDFETTLVQVIKHLHSVPLRDLLDRQSSESEPALSTAQSSNRQPKPAKIYCRRCGAMPGKQTICTGGYTAHDFTTGTSNAYCRRCGHIPGTRAVCNGGYTGHDFTTGTSNAYCRRCGHIPGTRAVCNGGYTAHDFAAS